MKIFLLILRLFPLTLAAQTEIYINVLTFDNKGQRLPNCDLELFVPENTISIKLRTDENGFVTALINVKSEVMLTGQCEDYYSQKNKLSQLDSVDQRDTIFTTLTFQPMLSILHGFTTINFDRTYALGQLADLSDIILIMTNPDQINPKQNYTKVEKIENDKYRLHYWVMEDGGLVDPARYRYDLKIKLKENDEVELTFGNKKEVYYIRGLKTKDGLYYELIKK